MTQKTPQTNGSNTTNFSSGVNQTQDQNYPNFDNNAFPRSNFSEPNRHFQSMNNHKNGKQDDDINDNEKINGSKNLNDVTLGVNSLKFNDKQTSFNKNVADKNFKAAHDVTDKIKYESERANESQFAPNELQPSEECNNSIKNPTNPNALENQISDDDDRTINFEGQCEEIRLTHFINLNKLLVQVFSGHEITEKDWNLSPMEEKILNAILKRKFYGKVQTDGIQLDESNRYSFINQLAKINTLKRPKDCYKMLLGRLFRILKRNYFEKHKYSNQNVYLFYQYYFGDLAKKENVPIQAYFYPFERNNKFISLFPKISHHLNFRYYEKIFRSERLSRDIKVILQKVYSDHFLELKFKFATLLKKWEKLFYNFDNDLAIVEKTILKYLQFNNRCKIPFTVTEIENSIGLFEKMILKFES